MAGFSSSTEDTELKLLQKMPYSKPMIKQTHDCGLHLLVGVQPPWTSRGETQGPLLLALCQTQKTPHTILHRKKLKVNPPATFKVIYSKACTPTTMLKLTYFLRAGFFVSVCALFKVLHKHHWGLRGSPLSWGTCAEQQWIRSGTLGRDKVPFSCTTYFVREVLWLNCMPPKIPADVLIPQMWQYLTIESL